MAIENTSSQVSAAFLAAAFQPQGLSQSPVPLNPFLINSGAVLRPGQLQAGAAPNAVPCQLKPELPQQLLG